MANKLLIFFLQKHLTDLLKKCGNLSMLGQTFFRNSHFVSKFITANERVSYGLTHFCWNTTLVLQLLQSCSVIQLSCLQPCIFVQKNFPTAAATPFLSKITQTQNVWKSLLISLIYGSNKYIETLTNIYFFQYFAYFRENCLKLEKKITKKEKKLNQVNLLACI